MTSNDNYITIEMFNAGIQELKAEMNQRFDKLETEIKTEIRFTNARIDNLAERIEDLKFFVTIAFAIIAIFISIVALVPIFRREGVQQRSEDLSYRNIRDIRALIREEFSLLNSINSANRGN